MAEISQQAVVIAGIIILVILLFLVFRIFGSGGGEGDLVGNTMGSWLH